MTITVTVTPALVIPTITAGSTVAVQTSGTNSVAALTWSGLTAPTANSTIAHAAFTTNMTWNTATTGNQMVWSSNSLSAGVLFTINCTSTQATSDTQQLLRLANSGANAQSGQTTYCGQFHNTKTGTNSTNIALLLDAASGTNNYALIAQAGRIGSGTSTPVAFFEDKNTSIVSVPCHLLSGTVFTGGSSTTTKPHFLIEPTGTTSNAWSTAGTQMAANAVSGFAGDLLQLQVSAVSKFSVSSAGNTLVAGTLGVTGVVTVNNNIAQTLSVNNALQIGLTNSNGGTGAFNRAILSNGTNVAVFDHYGTAYTGSTNFGIATAGTTALLSSGAGMMVGTTSATPLYLGTNGAVAVTIASGGVATFSTKIVYGNATTSNHEVFSADGNDSATDVRFGFRALSSTSRTGIRMALNSTTVSTIDSCLFDAGGAYATAAILGLNTTGGAVNIASTGATTTIAGLLLTAASASGSAGLRIPHGTAPSSPVDGDMWTTTAGLYVRINGATVGPLS